MLLRRLASALCLVLSFTNYSNAQVDSTTGNLINYGTSPTDTTSTWNNGVYVNTLCFQYGQAGNCGPNPSVRAASGSINFSYGTTDLNQVVNINKALAAGGTGVQLSGFNFGFMAKNGNGWDDGRQDYLDAYVKFYNAGGGLAATYDYANQTNRKYNWTNFQFSETFSSPVLATNFSNARVGFVGRDNNYWAGNYGPEIYDVSFSLKYKVDPCATNPAYATTCAGFSSVVTGPNQFDSSIWGATVNQAVAINTALTNAGVGATVHGFKYSFDYSIGQSWSGCTATNQDGSCSWYMDIPASVKLTASMTNSSNQSLYQKNYSLTGDGTSGTVSGQYLLPASLNQTALGSIRLAGSSMGTGSSLGNFSANIMYTPDPCANNPLYSTSCSGYNAAFAKQFIPSPTTVALAPPEAASTVLQPAGQQLVQAGPAPADQPPTQQQGPAPAPSASNTPVANVSPSATNPQPKPGEVQIVGSNKSPGGSSGGGSGPSALAMSVVASVQAKVNATEKATVQQANEAADAATAQAVQMAESVAGTAQANSIAGSMSSTTTSSTSSSRTASNQNSAGTFVLQTNTQTSVSSVNAMKPYAPPVETVSTAPVTSVVPGLDLIKMTPNSSTQVAMTQQTPVTYQPLPAPQQTQPVQQAPQVVQAYQAPVQLAQPVVSYSLTEPSTFILDTGRKQETVTYVEVELPKTDSFKMGTRGILSDYMNESTFMSMMGAETTQDGQVKRNVQPNEVAGGVDLAAMATQPKGYEAYAQMTLKDASFYKPEEIYKNQRTVDNARVLRGLQTGSDRLHQEMVDQQFKLGN